MSGNGRKEKAPLLGRVGSWLASGFRPVPIGKWEWFLMRLFFALLAVTEFWDWHPFAFTEQKDPIGLARLFDLTWLHEDWVYPTFLAIAAAGLVSYVSGFGLAISLPVLTIVHTLMRTYENSQGAIHHSHQIVTLVLLVQWVVIWWGAWSKWRGKKPFPTDRGLSLRSYLVFHTQAFVAGTYVIAALSKAINSKLMWVWNSPYLAFDLVKSHRVTYYRTLEPELKGDPVSAQWVFDHPWFARTAFGGAFFLELLALIALRNRVWAFWFGVALIAMHRSIHQIMHIRFERNEWVLLIFFVNLPFWHAWMTRKIDGELPQRGR